jgi:hypothetical protein
LRISSRKTEPERLVEAFDDLLDDLNSSLDELSRRWTKGKMLKIGLIAGGLAGLTAASAGISSLRRRYDVARGS